MRRNNWGGYASVFGLTGGCLALVIGCSDQATEDGDNGGEIGTHTDGVIIGSNDLVVVAAGGTNLDARYRPLVSAFGRLAKPSTTDPTGFSGYCTATHVGNGIVISAGHCFDGTTTRQNNISCASGTKCMGHVVQFGYTTGGTASTSKLTRILALQNTSTNKVDYSIFEVSPVPPDFVPVDWSAKAPSGAALSIFSHPQARTLEWSTTCTLQSPSSTQFSYQCDTEPGSSGATVLNDTALKVTGIHWGGGGNANSATFILSTPIGEFLQPPDGGGTGGAGGAGGSGGKAGAAGSGGKAGADAGDAATSDAATDGSSDAPRDGSDGGGGAAGAAGAAGASGTAGAAGAGGSGGAGGTAGSAGTGGAAGKAGSSGTGGTGGAGGKAGGAGTGGSTGGGGGAAGSAGNGGSGATAGTGGGTAGTSGKGGAGGTGGAGGSSAGTGGAGAGDDGGCSCRIGASSSPSGDHPASGVMAAFAMGVVASLRRARRKSTSRT
jgi:V8-like Glu-specific endopeptidase